MELRLWIWDNEQTKYVPAREFVGSISDLMDQYKVNSIHKEHTYLAIWLVPKAGVKR